MLTAVQARIKPLFRHVGGAVNVREAIAQPLNQKSAAYVVPIAERPAGNSRDVDIGQPLQDMVITFGVVIGLQSINDATGERALADLNTIRADLRQKLYGWQPAADYEPILLASSDLVGFAPNGLWWLDRFTTNTWYQGENA